MVKEIGNTFACEKNGCPLTFSNPSGHSGVAETAAVAAATHEAQPHIGIANLANLKMLRNEEPGQQDNQLYHVVNLTFNDPQCLTSAAVSKGLADAIAVSSVGDTPPEYFKEKYTQNGQKS
ncbi:hypothetical protein A3A60_00045 [Candidatus Curtissbacteria bacterium RIFCSPLOWO2_01_FULL_42_26]|uniref:Uncharacterized protein n=1 Tax=Candidatus Curtissbacteria bacterium RIFCSPLOWO2_01_FULL_42_26 TaxID=1797729 RepID=A0A1F5HZV3_9BACT|nr:MAG: hypothetical protein A3A60_00045 [Candidatus Curtissbacteria bacterium RIFCSPLOWO2_01_FULL_42_26]